MIVQMVIAFINTLHYMVKSFNFFSFRSKDWSLPWSSEHSIPKLVQSRHQDSEDCWWTQERLTIFSLDLDLQAKNHPMFRFFGNLFLIVTYDNNSTCILCQKKNWEVTIYCTIVDRVVFTRVSKRYWFYNGCNFN